MKHVLQKISLVLVVCLLMLTLCSCQGAKTGAQDELVIFTWSDYLPQEVLDAFTAETDIKVTYTYFTSNDEMLAKLQAVNGADYDLVLASDYIIDIARKEGLLQKLDKSVITNYGDIDPYFQGYFYDENNEYTVPFAAGTPLIVYDKERVGFEMTGYEDLWNPALKDSIVLIDDARVILGVTLISMGYSMNTTEAALIEQAAEKLSLMRDNIRAFNYDTPHEMLISGEAAVGFLFTPQAQWAVSEKPELSVCYPKEGMGFGIDSFFIPSHAPHSEAANKFLNYILQGEVSAQLSEYAWYMNCVTTAKEYLSEDFLNSKVLYIPTEILGETEFVEDVGSEAQQVYTDCWTRFKQQ